jgi:mono/diheme cytochrome c family protein
MGRKPLAQNVFRHLTLGASRLCTSLPVLSLDDPNSKYAVRRSVHEAHVLKTRRLTSRPLLPTFIVFAVWYVSLQQAADAQRPSQPRPAGPPPVAVTGAVASDSVDYNWDVRPILSDNCFRCHGPDQKGRMAGLRLDTRDGAYAALRSGATKHAIVPGDPEASELLKRVTAERPAVRMPPASTNKTLSPTQIDTLRKWIAQGGEYKPHWAFITPKKPIPPSAADAGHLTDVDRFILARLQRGGLAFSPEADKESLINRVTLTLTGLPPSLAEVDAFLRDKSPNAYERVVDRLLSSPAYGEHMGEYWLDLARYAESDGFLDDYHDRLFWPYRDCVIQAFNKNMPFDRFATWQIAGDLLPSHTREQALATAFLRVGKRTTENGSIDEEYRVEYVVDRANTIGTAFLGLTTGCARCHDHRYDPISQKDFYSLGGFFNSTDEPGFYAPGSTGVTAGPTLPWTDAATDAKLALAEREIKARTAALTSVQSVVAKGLVSEADTLRRSPAELARVVSASIQTGLVAYYPFETTAPIPDDQLPKSRPQGRRPSPPKLAPITLGNASGGGRRRQAPDSGASTQPSAGATAPGAEGGALVGVDPAAVRQFQLRLPSDLVRQDLVSTPSVVPGAKPAVLEAPVLKDGVKGKAFYFTDTNRGFLGEDVGYFERTQPFSLDFWVLPGQEYENSTVLNHRENDNNGGAGYTLQLEQQNHLRFDIMHSRAGNMLRVLTEQTLPVKKWTHVTVTYDGSSRAAGMQVYLNGVKAPVAIIRDNLTRTIRVEGGGTLGDEFMGLSFGKRFRETTLKDGAIDEIRVYARALTPLEIRYLEATTVGEPVARDEVLDLLVANDPRVIESASKLAAAREAQNQIISVTPEIPIMGDTPTPRPTYVLLRGQYSDHGEEVQPRGLGQIFPWDESLPQNRIGLAKWLFDPKNPLTSRVFVNRIWQMHFGRGLVETSEDFGSQGAIPTNPDLLDWLAVTFVESGWNVKQLHKAIVMSETYRQSSLASDELLKRDPDDLLLARFPRIRMTAEMVRDGALAASGLLVHKVGGPSVYPYQPDGMWDGFQVYRYPAAMEIPPDDQHRRSMYSFVKRNAPHPEMATFDFPDRGASLARRTTSNTPLQALVLLNDPQYVEAYRALSERVLKTVIGEDSQIETMFRLAIRRRPKSTELEPMQRFYAEQVQYYSTNVTEAAKLLKTGVKLPDPSLDPARLAAMTALTAVVMNTPDAYTLR